MERCALLRQNTTDTVYEDNCQTRVHMNISSPTVADWQPKQIFRAQFFSTLQNMLKHKVSDPK